MISFTPSERAPRDIHHLMTSAIAPRPIAFVATQSPDGKDNLSPFSFFNVFSSNPPILAFSPSYRGTDGGEKDTFRNLLATKQCTVSVVTRSITEQMNLASAPYSFGVDEFIKGGFTKRPSINVAPPSVIESPFSMECELIHHIDLSVTDNPASRGAAGNIMVLAVKRFHIDPHIFSDSQHEKIDPAAIDLVGRMGYAWYAHAIPPTIFEVPAPREQWIGIDGLPPTLRESSILTGKELAQLASVRQLPDSITPQLSLSASAIDALRTHLTNNDIYGAWHVIEQAALAPSSIIE
jgi:flavin reductase (DIM6/NTAB) family NADH-FMN oxidoreductase RutF